MMDRLTRRSCSTQHPIATLCLNISWIFILRGLRIYIGVFLTIAQFQTLLVLCDRAGDWDYLFGFLNRIDTKLFATEGNFSQKRFRRNCRVKNQKKNGKTTNQKLSPYSDIGPASNPNRQTESTINVTLHYTRFAWKYHVDSSVYQLNSDYGSSDLTLYNLRLNNLRKLRRPPFSPRNGVTILGLFSCVILAGSMASGVLTYVLREKALLKALITSLYFSFT